MTAVTTPLLLRSVLFVPGTRADRFDKAFAAGADAVVLDLEDGVEASRKHEARESIARWLRQPRTGRAACLVRVNAARSQWYDADLAWLETVDDAIDAVVLPKAETPEEIDVLAAPRAGRRVIPLLETPRGILDAAAILRVDTEVPAVLFGAEDLTAELGIPRTVDGGELLYARSRIVLAAAAAGADPIDAVFVDIGSPDLLHEDATRARALGFRGKMAIHPDQVPVINSVFTPTTDEITAARLIDEADQQARARGEGAFRLDNRMVDAPVVRRARRVLAVAERVTAKE